MIEISVKNNCNLIRPVEVLNQPHGTLFKMCNYNTYFISCGVGEPSVVVIWYSEESGNYKLATKDKKSLEEYSSILMVEKINGQISIRIEA